MSDQKSQHTSPAMSSGSPRTSPLEPGAALHNQSQPGSPMEDDDGFVPRDTSTPIMTGATTITTTNRFETTSRRSKKVRKVSPGSISASDPQETTSGSDTRGGGRNDVDGSSYNPLLTQANDHHTGAAAVEPLKSSSSSKTAAIQSDTTTNLLTSVSDVPLLRKARVSVRIRSESSMVRLILAHRLNRYNVWVLRSGCKEAANLEA